jgi:hypothetical protein
MSSEFRCDEPFAREALAIELNREQFVLRHYSRTLQHELPKTPAVAVCRNVV